VLPLSCLPELDMCIISYVPMCMTEISEIWFVPCIQCHAKHATLYYKLFYLYLTHDIKKQAHIAILVSMVTYITEYIFNWFLSLIFMSFDPDLLMSFDWYSWFFNTIFIMQIIHICLIMVYSELGVYWTGGESWYFMHPDSFACYRVWATKVCSKCHFIS
jgi:hypothetical protein